jgi:diadenylate cyclase
LRYSLKDLAVILTKANQAIQTLEKYKVVLDQVMTNLSALEFEELVTLHDVAATLRRVEMVLRIKTEIKRYIIELGTEGRLISMQMDELVAKTEHDSILLLKDYCRDPHEEKVKEMKTAMKRLSTDELLDYQVIVRLLGYPATNASLEEIVAPRGFRVLNKIPRLPAIIIANLVENFENLKPILMASIKELDEVDGIGEIRARAIKVGLTRIKEQMFIDRHI